MAYSDKYLLVLDDYSKKNDSCGNKQNQGIPKSTVLFAIIKYKRTGSLNRLVGSGRKCCLLDEHQKYIMGLYDDNHFITYVELAKKVKEQFGNDVCPNTIGNFMQNKGIYTFNAASKLHNFCKL